MPTSCEDLVMPTYTYTCGKCGTFDHKQSMTDDSLTHCPKCKKEVKKIFVPAGIKFNGSGFYSTDSRGK